MNEKRVEGYDGCPEQTVRSDIILLYSVCRLLACVAEHSTQISLRKNYSVNVPEQNWSFLLTAIFHVGQLLLEFRGCEAVGPIPSVCFEKQGQSVYTLPLRLAF